MLLDYRIITVNDLGNGYSFSISTRKINVYQIIRSQRLRFKVILSFFASNDGS